MIDSYYKVKGCDSDQLMLLQLIKTNLRYKPNSLTLPKFNSSTLSKYLV